MNSIKIHHPLVTCLRLTEQVMRKIQEIWKQIPICVEGYQASSLGNIRNHKTQLSHYVDHGGYYRVGIKLLSGVRRVNLVHRLVALTFLPNPKKKRTVNHKNCIKTDNRVENLEWATHQENTRHSFANNPTNRTGSGHYASILSESDVRDIRKYEYSYAEYGRRYGVAENTILKVIRRQTWKHI